MIEQEAILFVQTLHMKNGQDAIDLVWVPKPLERLCVGKTSEQCSSMDYCIRTTNRDVKMCRELAVPLSRLPSYPAGMVPRRQLSVGFFHVSRDRLANLQEFYRHLPPASLQRLSMDARVKARVKLTRTADDDSMYVEEITAVAPF